MTIKMISISFVAVSSMMMVAGLYARYHDGTIAGVPTVIPSTIPEPSINTSFPAPTIPDYLRGLNPALMGGPWFM